MVCKCCGVVDKLFFGHCNKCSQRVAILDKYPDLRSILTSDSIIKIESSSISSNPQVNAICQKCQKSFQISLISLLKQHRRNVASRSDCLYRCHVCSKVGKSKINIDQVKSVISVPLTEERYGGIPKNAREGKVVVQCEDCGELSDIKLSSLLHQARRHRLNGHSCVYKCFSCGIKRFDAVEKSVAARISQLASGIRSGLEIAMANRLSTLGIRYEEQIRVGPYLWDFFLSDYNVFVDVNNGHRRALKINEAKDKAKITHAEKYNPGCRLLIIEEKNFLNPLRVDKILLEFLGLCIEPKQNDFSFNEITIQLLNTGKGSRGSEYVNFLNSFHYAMCGRLGRVAYGAFLRGQLVAVCKFNSVTRKEVASSLGLKCTQVMEIDRFCIHPCFQKKNFASWFLSRCTKLLFVMKPEVEGLVSFADGTFGHSGTIYKASNWKLIGKTKPSYHYMDSIGIPINKKRVYDIASKLRMKEREYAEKHGLVKMIEASKTKFLLKRTPQSRKMHVRDV